jgi:hypothetical protein
MRILFIGLLTCFLLPATVAVAEPAPDALDEALAVAGLVREDLGWEARGWWERYPADIPGKLRHFDDLLAEPLAIPPFLRAMGASLEKTLAPERVARSAGNPETGALYKAVHDIGINKRFGGTRSYSANLTAELTPLSEALLEAWTAAGRRTKLATFGVEAEFPRVGDDLATTCKDLPDEVSVVLGRLVLDLLEARRWAVTAFRNVPLEMRHRVASRVDLGEKATDGLEFEPAIDDMERLWDEASLWYAASKTVEALDRARLSLAGPIATHHAALRRLRIDVDTPVGRIVVDGLGKSEIDAGKGAFLIVDLGGDDRHRGSVAASSPTLPLAALLDMGGRDRYESGDRAQGAGVTGVGVLLDAEGADRYSAGALGQGLGHFGLGALLDLGGDDEYALQYSGQGAGFYGVGLLFDLDGEDAYTLWSDGQGFGGLSGVGVLADRRGDDRYHAEPDPKITKRPSGHSENRIAVSNAQGCGMGRRGDGSDGHSWAGGLGVLLDSEGDDSYQAGNWAQGCGYWFGTGLLWDGAGNDERRATGWASASGAHFCIGAVIDESGDDLHSVNQNWGPAFGHDFTVAILLDESGDDRYECGGEGGGFSINRSVALHLDGGGDDVHEYGMAERRPGFARFDARFLDRDDTTVYWTEPTSVGLFLDLGGDDSYPEGLADGTVLTDDRGSENARSRNRGIFVDRATGRIDLDRPHGSKRR